MPPHRRGAKSGKSRGAHGARAPVGPPNRGPAYWASVLPSWVRSRPPPPPRPKQPKPQRPVARGPAPAAGNGDITLKRFLACVANPFNGPVSRGIAIAGNTPSTAVIRRRCVSTVALTPGLSGSDIFIPNGITVDPFVAVATMPSIGAAGPLDQSKSAAWLPSAVSAGNTGTGLAVSIFNYDATNTIPPGSYGRVVSSGLRITPIESSTTVNGVFYHYWVPPNGADGGPGNLGPTPAFGSVKTSVAEAIGIYRATAGKPITLVNPTYAGWQSINTIADVVTVSPGLTTAVTPAAGATAVFANWPSVGGVRLFFDGSGSQRFIFEVCTVVEYYHDNHRNFTAPVVVHANGDQIVTAVNAHLAMPASQNAGSSSLYTKLEAATATMAAGARFVGTAMSTAYGAVRGYKAIRGAMMAGEAARDFALLAM